MFKVGDVVRRLTPNHNPAQWGEEGERYSVFGVAGTGDILIMKDSHGYADKSSFELAGFEVGDKVCLRPLPNYTYGRGDVMDGEVGTVTRFFSDRSGEGIEIDFDRCHVWGGKPSEVFLHKGPIEKPKFELEMQGFPRCCTASLVANFGETGVAIFSEKIGKDDIVEALRTCIKDSHSRGKAAVVCTTNSEQKEANAALREVGFHSSAWMDKTLHPETKLRLWWYPINA